MTRNVSKSLQIMAVATIAVCATCLVAPTWAQDDAAATDAASEDAIETTDPAPATETEPTTDPAPAADPAPADGATPANESETEAAETDAESVRPEPGPKAKEFQAVYKQWTDLLKKLRALKAEFPTADPERQSEIAAEYGELIDQGRKLQPSLVAAAVGAYEEAPNVYPDVTEFLWQGVVAYELGRDNFEKVYKITKMMIDKSGDEMMPKVFGVGGYAALNTNHFDEAEAWLAKADPEMILHRDPNQELPVSYFASRVPELRELWAEEVKIREAEAEADDLPRVLLKTDVGDITLELFENEAPNTVANFVSLVEDGRYDGTVFHRVLPGFMAQGGDVEHKGGFGGPGYYIKDEVKVPGFRKHFRGSLSMAKSAMPDTGGSQFFLTFTPTSHLDGVHTVFGRVIDGIDVLAELQRVDPDNPEFAPEPSKIIKAEVIRKRDHEYEPETLPER